MLTLLLWLLEVAGLLFALALSSVILPFVLKNALLIGLSKPKKWAMRLSATHRF